MPTPTCNDFAEYDLDLLDEEDRRAFEAHLPRRKECQAKVEKAMKKESDDGE